MTTNELGYGLKRHVRAQIERALVQRGRECIIDRQQRCWLSGAEQIARRSATTNIGFDGDSSQSRSESAAALIQPSVSSTAMRVTLQRPFCLPRSARAATP